ncbi:TPM domain-containing protein [Gordonia polyisoprenivorans]|uniref:TPM domain-containing protein n=1 Tax=Gordonia polyisoprenivorans TaxID=84595 RepID=UPI001AD74B5B|nr:TPM domain-containing protein [Gordonia polyisoprenivorans]QTI69482.1 TPM domain-containing protein [Gordonia polyisoprenivorans]
MLCSGSPGQTRHAMRSSGRVSPTTFGFAAVMLLAAVLFGPLLLGTGAAHAEPPSRLPEPISDPAGVLSVDQRTQIQTATDNLYNDHSVQLWVVYVKNFDGQTPEQWGRKAAELSGLDDHEVLLAVATEDRAYWLGTIGSVDGVTQSNLSDIATGDVVPALKKGNFPGAGVAAADGLSDALTPSHTGLIVAGSVAGVAVVGAGGMWVYSRRRKRRALDSGLETLREQELTVDQLAAQPLDVLDPWSREVLTDTDNAIRTSEEELRLAVGEFGEAQTAPFTAAVARAREALAASFTVRQRLDDNIPETPDEQRSMLLQIITACTDADGALDAQVAAFDEMRNLLINADARFDEITRRLVDLRTRADASARQLEALVARHGAQQCASILHNVELARQEIGFAERSADQGREAIARPAGEQGPAVADIRAAEGAITQATHLLDAIDNAEGNIAAAHSRMPALITEVEGELAEATQLGADGGPELASAVATATTALQSARTGFDADPLGAFTALVDADAALDKALDTARGAAAERTRRSEMLGAALTSAQAKVSAARDFIGTRRGAVQSVARTRLSEAERLLGSAQDIGATDPLAAADAARRAGSLADQALIAAQGDVVGWQQGQQPRAHGSSTAGAVLGGILVDSFLRGTMRGGGGFGGGGFGGGYTSGGRSPGSFGGSSSSGRIGVGGRF